MFEALNFFVLFRYVEKKVGVLDCFYIHFNRPRKIYLNFKFLRCLEVVFIRFYNLFFLNRCC
jgi:hypothetical protein